MMWPPNEPGQAVVLSDAKRAALQLMPGRSTKPCGGKSRPELVVTSSGEKVLGVWVAVRMFVSGQEIQAYRGEREERHAS